MHQLGIGIKKWLWLLLALAVCAPASADGNHQSTRQQILLSGAGWQFTGPPPAASIINYGRINADAGGFVYLIGANINNQGSINAPSGNIGLCAGHASGKRVGSVVIAVDLPSRARTSCRQWPA